MHQPSETADDSQLRQWPATDRHDVQVHYLKPFLHWFYSLLLAGQTGTREAALRRHKEHLRIALVPHLRVGIQRQITVTHPLFHQRHLLTKQLRRLHHHRTTTSRATAIPEVQKTLLGNVCIQYQHRRILKSHQTQKFIECKIVNYVRSWNKVQRRCR